ncbi:FAD-dependent oxidoreductase [Bradyrhizobium guangdongense]|uniref:FAD-dependent oxidoreductase n=1 Tax=Bradyrhizobium guangdongense TaxID=1325090 RepID=UPI0024C0ABD0|nr:FAD-dependent oxidoreductase [Bradyrhizobium guangdongense]
MPKWTRTRSSTNPSCRTSRPIRSDDNIVAAGRCIDADKAALSSVRVMGPCMTMGAVAGSGSVHQIDIDALKHRVRDNLERTD